MVKIVIKKLRSLFFTISIAFFFAFKKIEDELKADPLNLFKTEQQAQIKKQFKKFEDGVFDQAYVQHFYEVLKKADEFIRSANPAKVQRTAAKFGFDYGMRDKFGRKYEHYGFFDEKHKYSGKSPLEVRDLEVKERMISDEDDFPVIVMYQNKKEFSLKESADMILNNDAGFYAPEIHEVARMKSFPLMIVRDKDVANRLEQLTEFLHVKQITSEHKILEFFIPKKFGLETISDDDPIFQELINVKQAWFKDEYGDRNMYRITGFYKRAEYNKLLPNGKLNPNGFDIIKFKATDIIELK